MKFIILIGALFAALVDIGCGNAAPPVQTTTNTPVVQNANDHPQTMIAHSTENQPPPGASGTPAARTKWTQSGSPIDVVQFNADIKKAEAELIRAQGTSSLKSKSGEQLENSSLKEAKANLANAFFKRGFALTEARQYASALGDYRKALKLDPSNAEAKQWIEQIIQIYDSMNKEAPKEGEEPPPLPYKNENK